MNPTAIRTSLAAFLFAVCQLYAAVVSFAAPPLNEPLASAELVHEEQNGFVAVEAEHFSKQKKAELRAWYRTSAEESPGLQPDADPAHVAGASGGAYLEALPDTRRNHGEKLIKGENFSNEPGRMAVLSYKVHFSTPGKYYVWARTFPTGTEDNGLHVGIDGTWPESGQRMQWTGKNQWQWDSKQRTDEVHTGVPGQLFLMVESAGEHTIQFSMREDGFEFDQWLMTTDSKFEAPANSVKLSGAKAGKLPPPFTQVQAKPTPTTAGATDRFAGDLFGKRGKNGDADTQVSGELKQWHKVSITLDGPFAHEKDNLPNPFTDFRFAVSFSNGSGKTYTVPGYFAADGNAGESSAESGTKWRAHFSPDEAGIWNYKVRFVQGEGVALNAGKGDALAPYDSVEGSFEIAPSDKTGRDLRGKGQLRYVGKNHLQFAGNREYFLKAGADAPETFLGYQDFDGTVAGNPKKVPLKTWKPHMQDWNAGDPTWKGGKGKGMIGAINYLSGKGCNVFSFLTYNAGGDGDNVWPFISRDEKFHYDCSKLDQWGTVFDHATTRGMFLHFKLQETENDDNRRGHKNGKNALVRTSLDGGDLGLERKLYLRELIARFGHNLALNWNLGEENTQSTAQQKAMAQYIAEVDPYNHPIVIHSYPDQQDKVYRPLLGAGNSSLRGASLQNSDIKDCHSQVVKWVRASNETGTPWIVSFDEPGNAQTGMPADPGYPGMPDDFDGPTIDETRKFALWGTLLAGGGVEYYFGYKLPQNDLVCEDWRSRDRSWDYCRIALDFFRDHKIPYADMRNHDELVGNPDHDNSAYCFAKANQIYLVYLPRGGKRTLDLTAAANDVEFTVHWFDPRKGGALVEAGKISGGGAHTITAPDEDNDWLAVVRNEIPQP